MLSYQYLGLGRTNTAHTRQAVVSSAPSNNGLVKEIVGK